MQITTQPMHWLVGFLDFQKQVLKCMHTSINQHDQTKYDSTNKQLHNRIWQWLGSWESGN